MLSSIDVSTLVNKSLIHLEEQKELGIPVPSSAKKKEREESGYVGPPGLKTDEPDAIYDSNSDYLKKLNNELNINTTLIKQMK